jgi:predicted transcriptional regulator
MKVTLGEHRQVDRQTDPAAWSSIDGIDPAVAWRDRPVRIAGMSPIQWSCARAELFVPLEVPVEVFGEQTSVGPRPGQLAGCAVTGRRRRSPGSLETEVLTVLFAAGTELSPAGVRARLGAASSLSYSTVVTTLARLHAKGVVQRRRGGRAYLYSAPADAASLVAWRMNRLLDEQSDHRPALTHFIAALSPGDEALVRKLLADDGEPATDGDGTGPGTDTGDGDGSRRGDGPP